MATINDRRIIQQLVNNDGRYEDDTPVVRIVEYTNAWGRRTWGVSYGEHEREKYMQESEFISFPVIIWDNKIGKLNELCNQDIHGQALLL